MLQQHFPHHTFIGEETAAANGGQVELTDQPTWMVSAAPMCAAVVGQPAAVLSGQRAHVYISRAGWAATKHSLGLCSDNFKQMHTY
jgi:hypothetical protein